MEVRLVRSSRFVRALLDPMKRLPPTEVMLERPLRSVSPSPELDEEPSIARLPSREVIPTRPSTFVKAQLPSKLRSPPIEVRLERAPMCDRAWLYVTLRWPTLTRSLRP